MAFQQVIALGNLGKDVETRYSPDGKAVANFSIAVSEKYKEKETTEWFNCVCFGKTAELAAQYLGKGSQCLVTGKLQTEEYTDKQGEKKRSTRLLVDKLTFVGKRETGAAQAATKPRPNEKTAPDFGEDESVPF